VSGGDCELAVVIPVHNEERCVEPVIEDWCTALAAAGVRYRLLVVDDGSTDATAKRLEALRRRHRAMTVVHQPRTGHGQACVAGYRHALTTRAPWVLQIDSDGQCDPAHFAAVWRERAAPAVLGCRVRREDGGLRTLGSLAIRAMVRVAAGAAVRDANVPYRLVRIDVLAAAIRDLPGDIVLANVLLAAILRLGLGQRLRYVPIVFRRRLAGRTKTPLPRLVGRVLVMGLQLRRCRRLIALRAADVRRVASPAAVA
jgi:dolichol-phosphate mannosyltransferase